MATRNNDPIKLESITVRMYRPGLGDCFLLTFRGTQGTTPVKRFMLIDCGVLTGTASESERLRKIVESIQKETSGVLHTMVVTHEHADHLSGFGYHKEIFADRSKFQIGEVWLGWTEDKDDPEVREIYSAVRAVPIQVLEKALEELKKTGHHSFEAIKKVTQFLQNNGMDEAKEIAKAHDIEPLFLRPSADADGPSRVITWDDFGGVRFHVLGPPEDPELLKRSDPPKTKTRLDQGEALNSSTAFAMAVMHMAAAQGNLSDSEHLSISDIEEMFELSLPFESALGIPLDALNPPARKTIEPVGEPQVTVPADVLEFFKRYYGLRHSLDKTSGPDWRRIDSDWLDAAGALALNLDGDINNTSLVLAIEIGEGGKVLLFAADAQYGNWLSWAMTRRGMDLLRRTVFYKVGHHGSHNATLKEGGLSLMGKARGFESLVAMIPVDTEKAKTKGKGGWKMPEEELRALLIKQTRGRLIIACEGTRKGEQCPDFVYEKPLKPPSGARISTREWKSFLAAIDIDQNDDRLWVEYTQKF
jgi:hypothetical protein